MVCNRLIVVCHEDLDTITAPWIVPFLRGQATLQQIHCKARLMVGNRIRMMARAPKSRAACHFGAAIGLRSLLEDRAPEIPDFALDMTR